MTVILFISTIIFFVGLDLVLQRRRVAVTANIKAQQPVRAPAGIFFSRTHSWLALFPTGRVRLGVDDFILRLLGNPRAHLLKKDGDRISRGEPIIELRDGPATISLRAPIEGTIVGTNVHLEEEPGRLKGPLYSDGWAYTIQPKHVSELTGMLLGENTGAWLREEYRRLREFLTGQTGNPNFATLPDGGFPVDGAMQHLTEAQWGRFEEQFLSEQR